MLRSLPMTLVALISLSDATGTFQMDIERRTVASTSQTLRRRSSKPISETLKNDIFLYMANVSVGTPGQPISLQLDTGSSDLWLPTVDCVACSNVSAGGCPGGSFDITQSTTADIVGPGLFSIAYGDGTHTSGDYFKDSLTIGGVSLDQFTMGLGIDDSTIPYGLIGIGYDNNEAIVAESGESLTPYPNFIDAMVEAGIVSSQAYSLWLNDVDTNTGSILFGGIDTSKYSGDLIMMDILLTPGYEVNTDFNVAWTSLSVTSSSGTDVLTNSEFPVRVVLDSGTALTRIPVDLADLIFEEFGVTENGFVPCSLAEREGSVDYGFGGEGGVTIKVPISELVEPIPASANLPSTFASGTYAGQEICAFGIAASDNGNPVLFGDTFLRSAYVVYDLYNAQIALAQTVFNSTAKSHVVAFASEGAPIPSATEVKVQSTAIASVTLLQPAATSLNAAAGFTSSTSASSSKATGGSSAGGGKKSDAGRIAFSRFGMCLVASWMVVNAWLAF